MNREYDTCTDPLWCEDCKHFGHTDMGGEGYCDKVEGYTWYGCPICHSYTPKGADNEQREAD